MGDAINDALATMQQCICTLRELEVDVIECQGKEYWLVPVSLNGHYYFFRCI